MHLNTKYQHFEIIPISLWDGSASSQEGSSFTDAQFPVLIRMFIPPRKERNRRLLLSLSLVISIFHSLQPIPSRLRTPANLPALCVKRPPQRKAIQSRLRPNKCMLLRKLKRLATFPQLLTLPKKKSVYYYFEILYKLNFFWIR